MSFRSATVVAGLVGAMLVAAACGIDALGTGPADAGGGGATTGDGSISADGAPLGDGESNGDGGGLGDGASNDSSGGGRVLGAIALYGFDEGDGGVVRDISGVAPALDLTIQVGSTTHWIAGGLAIDAPSLLFSVAAQKIVAACKASNEVTLEAWVKPVNTTQGNPNEARIAGLTLSSSTLDLSLNAFGPQYLFRLRTSTSNEANNDLISNGGASTALTHVVTTRHADGTRRGYVNGQVVAQSTTLGDLSTWADFAIAVANEHTTGHPWLGEIHLVAFYARALTDAEVKQNLAAGP